MEVEDDQIPLPRRSMRRLALSELNEPSSTTPTKAESPDERVIIQRGRRCKPITWSPLDYDRSKIIQKSTDKTPEKVSPGIELVSSRLRRRLIMSPTKPTSEELGSHIAKKLRALERREDEKPKKQFELNSI